MFTGIVEETGKVQTVTDRKIVIECHEVLENTKIGDSIAVNGVCLTVTEIGKNSFSADISPETFKVSCKLKLGDINGIPRVLDAGQCNDSYSIAVIALKLQEIFGLDDINDLPVIYNIAWYEQKAVLVLLALLSLGIKNIHLGPTLPAFLSPNVAKVLVENFGIAGITTVEEDMNLFFGN